ncbi:hypothetical protein Y032_0003g1663 [Ancylostoma ceylanicum]|uniref:Uncharacterized protein n=1 Tax=Ancylostoma ceylanicum TaxID=53326 RepID=A0A016VZ47_9BILA|nr:hypothetical protein Y032_0003g1663 [Ancylostoma ceylanicum]
MSTVKKRVHRLRQFEMNQSEPQVQEVMLIETRCIDCHVTSPWITSKRSSSLFTACILVVTMIQTSAIATQPPCNSVARPPRGDFCDCRRLVRGDHENTQYYCFR